MVFTVSKHLREFDIQLTQPFAGSVSNGKFKSFILHFHMSEVHVERDRNYSVDS